MKNKHITSLEKPIPIDMRIELYKEAIEYIISTNNNVSKARGLCLLLPMLLWDLRSHTSKDPNEQYWDFYDTPLAFPELTKDIIEEIENGTTVTERNDLRLSYLDSFILKLSNPKIK